MDTAALAQITANLAKRAEQQAISDRALQLESSLALAEPLRIEVDDLLMRLPKFLPFAAEFPDELIELASSLSELRSHLMDYQRAVSTAHPEVNARAA